MELAQIADRASYIPGPVNIGVIKSSGNNCILIDSGLHDDNARKVHKLLEQNGLKVIAIINTHSHADHCGGNSLIKARSGCKIYAPAFEAAIIENPMLEPFYLFSGAFPIRELQTDFLMAKPSKVDTILSPGEVTIDGCELEIVDLSGHAIGQIGIAFDGVLFCADSIFSKETIEKHKVLFFTDIEKTRQTLERLKESKLLYPLPSHGALLADIRELAAENLRSIDDTAMLIKDILRQPESTEGVLKEVCRQSGITIQKATQYFLMKASVMAYLSYLSNRKEIKFEMRDNELVWLTSPGSCPG